MWRTNYTKGKKNIARQKEGGLTTYTPRTGVIKVRVATSRLLVLLLLPFAIGSPHEKFDYGNRPNNEKRENKTKTSSRNSPSLKIKNRRINGWSVNAV